jgi:hypothetical protein
VTDPDDDARAESAVIHCGLGMVTVVFTRLDCSRLPPIYCKRVVDAIALVAATAPPEVFLGEVDAGARDALTRAFPWAADARGSGQRPTLH